MKVKTKTKMPKGTFITQRTERVALCVPDKFGYLNSIILENIKSD